jgi:signal transduction histidine kinase
MGALPKLATMQVQESPSLSAALEPTEYRQYNGQAGVSAATVLRHWWSMEPERPGTAVQYLLATAFYNTLIGVVLTVFFSLGNSRDSVLNVLVETSIISQCIGFSIHLGFSGFYRFTTARWRARLPKPVFRALHFLIPICCVYLGYTLAFALDGRNFLSILVRYPRTGIMIFLIGLVVSFIWYLVMDSQTRRLRAEADEARAREATAAAQKQASDAELRALQAQIEPHFLFNTLANVQALIDYEPTKARQMLESFIEYLRATLDASRRTQGTLGDEVAMLQRYLQLMQVRMGARLHTVWDIEPGLLSQPLAPLLLQPLVENAIKYGLEPKIEGGTLTIRATSVEGRVRVVVQDDGVGMHQASTARKTTSSAQNSGSGTGLKNVLARLQSTRGSNATLVITDTETGCAATLEFDAQNTPLNLQDTSV